MIEIREVLRGWLDGAGLRVVAERAGVDRKTARRYVQAAQQAGLERTAGLDAVDDDLVDAVVAAVRPSRPGGHDRRGRGCSSARSRSAPGSSATARTPSQPLTPI